MFRYRGLRGRRLHGGGQEVRPDLPPGPLAHKAAAQHQEADEPGGRPQMIACEKRNLLTIYSRTEKKLRDIFYLRDFFLSETSEQIVVGESERERGRVIKSNLGTHQST